MEVEGIVVMIKDFSERIKSGLYLGWGWSPKETRVSQGLAIQTCKKNILLQRTQYIVHVKYNTQTLPLNMSKLRQQMSKRLSHVYSILLI